MKVDSSLKGKLLKYHDSSKTNNFWSLIGDNHHAKDKEKVICKVKQGQMQKLLTSGKDDLIKEIELQEMKEQVMSDQPPNMIPAMPMPTHVTSYKEIQQ